MPLSRFSRLSGRLRQKSSGTTCRTSRVVHPTQSSKAWKGKLRARQLFESHALLWKGKWIHVIHITNPKVTAKSLKNKVETLHYKLQTLFGMIFHQAKQASRPKITAELFCSPYKNLETLKVSHFAEARSKSRITMVTLAPSSVWLLQQVAFKEHRSSHLRCHQTTFRQTSTNSEVRLAGDHTLEIWFDGPVRSNLKMFHTKRAYPNCTVSHVSLQTILELYVLIKEWEPSTSSRKCECKKRHFQTLYGFLTNGTSTSKHSVS